MGARALVGTSGYVYTDWRRRFYVYFNNDARGHAVRNARRLRQLVG